MIRKIARAPRVLRHCFHEAINEGLGSAYSLNDPHRREIALRLVYRLQQADSLLGDHRHGRAILMSGISCPGNLPFRVGMVGNWCSGERNNQTYYQRLLFKKGIAEVIDLGACPASQFQTRANELSSQVDLLLVLGNSLVVKPPSSGEWMLGPAGVRMAFDFHPGETWEAVEARIHQSHNLKILRRYGLRYRTSRADEDFRLFYHQLYVPMVQQRYGACGDILHEPGLFKIFRKNGLILLVEDPDGELVGGGLAYLWRGVFYGLLNGVQTGSREKVQQGALVAWYYYAMKYAFEHGFRRFDTGVCEPYLNDGVFIHKQRWGCEPSIDYWKPLNLLIWSPSGSDHALDWMKTHLLMPEYSRWGGEQLCSAYASLAARCMVTSETYSAY